MNYDYNMMDLTLLETQNALLASQLEKHEPFRTILYMSGSRFYPVQFLRETEPQPERYM